MKCQILFSDRNKETIIDLSSAEFAQRVAKVCIVIKSIQDSRLKRIYIFCSIIINFSAKNTKICPYLLLT